MTNWSTLKKGDLVDIVASTPGIKILTLEKDIEFLCHFVLKLGLVPRVNIDGLRKGAQFFSLPALETRKKELIKAVEAHDSKAIWMIRGGYGTSQILQALRNTLKPKNCKLVIGYSDINCLHLWLHKFWNWPSLHARVLYEYLENQEPQDIDSLKDIIFGKKEFVEFNNLIPLNRAANVINYIEGKITGGTIQVLQSGIGLDWQFEAKDKIIFLEEIFDRGVRLYRSLDHFHQLGLLRDAKAIIFGDIMCGKELDGSENCDLAIKNFADQINIPVFSISGIGHGRFNHPLPLNTMARIKKLEQDFNLSVNCNSYI